VPAPLHAYAIVSLDYQTMNQGPIDAAATRTFYKEVSQVKGLPRNPQVKVMPSYAAYKDKDAAILSKNYANKLALCKQAISYIA
jgi:hypothetical protein